MESIDALSQNMKTFRDINSYSQEHCAELCDISTRYWRKLEHNQAVPTAIILFKLSKGMGVSIGQLFDDELVLMPRQK